MPTEVREHAAPRVKYHGKEEEDCVYLADLVYVVYAGPESHLLQLNILHPATTLKMSQLCAAILWKLTGPHLSPVR
jgi:hypothetical protein